MTEVCVNLLSKYHRFQCGIRPTFMTSFNPSRYPPALRQNAYVQYHGKKIHDPYRWVENVDCPETESWVNAEADLTESYLSSTPCSDLIQKFENRLTEVWNYPRFSAPFKHGKRWFQYRNSGLQNQSVLYVFESDPDSDASILLDPNTFSSDGTIALMGTGFSECGTYLAYALSKSGSDWRTISIIKTDTQVVQPDEVQWVKFSSICWTHDNAGFFYCRYPQPKSQGDALGTEVDEAKNQLVYYHRLGRNQSEDILVYSDASKPEYMFSVEVTDCGRYAILSISESCEPMNKVYVASLQDFQRSGKDLIFKPVIDKMENQYDYITNIGTNFVFRTNSQADRYRIISIDITQPTVEVEIISESPTDVLESAVASGNQLLVLSYIHDVSSLCLVADHRGNIVHHISLPTVGAVTEVNARHDSTDVYFKFSSFIDPGTVFYLNTNNFTSKIWRRMAVPGIVSDLFSTEQVFYPSSDGTKIPMFVIRRKDSKQGPRPCILYGYGGFNISLTPYFSVLKLVFVQHCHGVYAVANLRGGGEYGKQWHQAGTKQRKQNVFDDFIAGAEFLVKRGDTTNKQLAITGGSNGGLLVAVCLNQRPDLFGCVVAHVGVMDMLRFHKFTIGHAWTSDYGNAEENEADFNTIIKYSPVHNVGSKDDPYPPTLICTGDHDDRVVPLHSFKLAAELQHTIGQRPTQVAPLLIRIDRKAGHGAGKPLAKIINEHSDVFGFIAHSLGSSYLP